MVTKEQNKKLALVELQVEFELEHEYLIDKVELLHALYNMVSDFARAGEMRILGGLEGIDVQLQVTDQIDRIINAAKNCDMESCNWWRGERCLTCEKAAK